MMRLAPAQALSPQGRPDHTEKTPTQTPLCPQKPDFQLLDTAGLHKAPPMLSTVKKGEKENTTPPTPKPEEPDMTTTKQAPQPSL